MGDEGRREGRGRWEVDVGRDFNGRTCCERKRFQTWLVDVQIGQVRELEDGPHVQNSEQARQETSATRDAGDERDGEETSNLEPGVRA